MNPVIAMAIGNYTFTSKRNDDVMGRDYGCDGEDCDAQCVPPHWDGGFGAHAVGENGASYAV